MNISLTAYLDTYGKDGVSKNPKEKLDACISTDHDIGDCLEITLSESQDEESIQAVFIPLKNLEKAIQRYRKVCPPSHETN